MTDPRIWLFTVDSARAGLRADKALSDICRPAAYVPASESPIASVEPFEPVEDDALSDDDVVSLVDSAGENGADVDGAPIDTATGAPPSLSRTQIQNLIESGHVRVNDVVLKKSITLRAGDRVAIMIDAPSALEIEAVDLPIEILYQDAHLVVVNKPAGLSVHPSETESGPTLVHALLHHVKDLSGIGGRLRPGIVHRLDKFTSGVMVVAKSDEAHRNLVTAFADHSHERRYWAYAYGAPELWGAHDKRVETLIGRDPGDRKRMSASVKQGKTAITVFKLLERYRAGGREGGGGMKNPAFASKIEAILHTGRTHQVRVHLAHLGHSILGDTGYGRPSIQQPKWKNLPNAVQTAVAALPGQALHARVLGFNHPVTGVAIRFEAELPPLLQDLERALAGFTAGATGA